MELTVGAVVRDRCWGGRYTGTLIGREDDWVFVTWHGSFVENQLSLDDGEVWSEAPAELRSWRGGLGVLTPDGDMRVEPVGGR